jgi:uncharacterized protein (TIGR03435 family)
MLHMKTLAVTALFITRLTWPQTVASPVFEVASVKPDDSRFLGVRGGPGTDDPERISYSGMPLAKLIVTAFGIYQEQLVGPEWMNSEKYAVNAKIPPGTSKHQFELMLQALLSDRFRLSVRHELRNSTAYALVIAKGGPKLKPAAAANSTTAGGTQSSPFQSLPLDGNGCPFREPGNQGYTSAHACATFRNVSTAELAQDLEHFVGIEILGPPTARVHVADRTNLRGNFDFTLHFTNNPRVPRTSGNPSDEVKGPTIFEALGEIGLRLEKETIPLEFVIVEHVEKVPTAN